MTNNPQAPREIVPDGMRFTPEGHFQVALDGTVAVYILTAVELRILAAMFVQQAEKLELDPPVPFDARICEPPEGRA